MTVLHAEFRQSATNRWEAIQNEYRHFKIHDKKNLFVINRLHLLQQNEQKERYMLVFLLFGPSIFIFTSELALIELLPPQNMRIRSAFLRFPVCLGEVGTQCQIYYLPKPCRRLLTTTAINRRLRPRSSRTVPLG